MTPDERVDVKLREIKHVLVQMISLSKLGRLKLGEAQQAYQDVDGDLSKVGTREAEQHHIGPGCTLEARDFNLLHVWKVFRCSGYIEAELAWTWVTLLLQSSQEAAGHQSWCSCLCSCSL